MRQTQDNTLRIASISDATLFQVLEDLKERFGDNFSASIKLAGHANVSINANNFDSVRKSFGLSAKVINQAIFNTNNSLIIVFYRSITTVFGQNQTKLPSAWECEFFLDKADNTNPDTQDVIAVLAILGELSKRDALPLSGDLSEYSRVIAAQIAELADLQRQTTKQATDERERQSAEVEELKRQLHEEYLARGRELDQKIRERESSLDEAEAALAGRKRELDDRDHMHVRRALRESITSDMHARLEKPSVSKDLRLLRSMIMVICVFSAFGLVALSTWGAIDLSNVLAAESVTEENSLGGSAASGKALSALPVDEKILLYLRVAAPLAGALAFVVYLLGWLRKIHHDDHESQQNLELYAYDINRASWSIETVLELQQRENAQIPKEWLEGVTRNLFQRTSKKWSASRKVIR